VTPTRGERGYATVAAVAAIAVFAMVSLTLVAGNRIAVGDAGAEIGRARVRAAADAGLAMALDGLLVADRAMRWSIDGRVHEADFNGTHIRIMIEDERGKVPLNLLDDDTAKALAEAAGRSGNAAQIAADSLLDWTDDDDEARLDGAESEFYAPRGTHPRNGPPRSIDELTLIRGWDRAMIEQIRPFVTIWFGRASFDARFAQPKAIGIMLGGGEGNPLAIQRQREADGQRTAIELGDDIVLTGRPLTVAVEASDATGARAVHRTVIELTGARAQPYVVRGFE
jgi:general secretion pathway protein K